MLSIVTVRRARARAPPPPRCRTRPASGLMGDSRCSSFVFGRERRRPRVGPARVHERELPAEALAPPLEQRLRAAVARVHAHHVIARSQQREERARDRRHARGKQQRVLGALEVREALLGGVDRRVALALVERARATAAAAPRSCRRGSRTRTWRCARSACSPRPRGPRAGRARRRSRARDGRSAAWVRTRWAPREVAGAARPCVTVRRILPDPSARGTRESRIRPHGC